MLVMILQKAPTSLRGELSRWLIEPATGVFMGNPTARVRDELWQKAVAKCRNGTVTQIWTSRTPQGYSWRVHGQAQRRLTDVDGMALVRSPAAPSRSRRRKT